MGDAPFSEWRAKEVAHALYLFGGIEMLFDQQESCWRSILLLLEQEPDGGRTGLANHARMAMSLLQEKQSWLKERKRRALEEIHQGQAGIAPVPEPFQ